MMKLAAVPITLENCAKTYRGAHQPALEPLNLTIAAGETLVLLGPSGCGKTTTLRLIAGLERPDPGGIVRFGEEDVTQRPIEARQVGMVFQNYALFPNMTVAENIAYGLRIRKTPAMERDQRVKELLDLTRLTPLSSRAIHQLSGGQRQRVALARALAPRPRVLLLDEPLTALDAQLREALREEMDQLLRELGITSIYVTHDQAEAMALGDRIVVMGAGRIEQLGTPREIYHRPANRTVARFIGKLNCLAGAPQAPGESPQECWFRPEDAELCAPGTGQWVGTVESATFLGDRTRLCLGSLGAEAVSVDAPGRRSFAPGEQVGLHIPPEAWIVLPQEAQP